MRLGLASLALATLAGCAGKPAATASNVLALQGPGGAVALGDPLTQAKTAFPAPKESLTFDKSMGFAILGGEGWAWQNDKANAAFEVALKDGKVVGILNTLMSASADDEVEDQVRALGEPTKKAEGTHALMWVWIRADRARIFVRFKNAALFGSGAYTAIGAIADLKMLGYDANDPQTFIKQMDSATKLIPPPSK